MTRTLLALLILTLLPGCFLSRAQQNKALDANQIASLTPGKSTAQDVVQTLGAPNDVVQLGRRSAYRYDHTQAKRAVLFLLILGFVGSDTQADRTWVFFNEDEVLTHVGTTLDADKAEYRVPGFWGDD